MEMSLFMLIKRWGWVFWKMRKQGTKLKTKTWQPKKEVQFQLCWVLVDILEKLFYRWGSRSWPDYKEEMLLVLYEGSEILHLWYYFLEYGRKIGTEPINRQFQSVFSEGRKYTHKEFEAKRTMGSLCDFPVLDSSQTSVEGVSKSPKSAAQQSKQPWYRQPQNHQRAGNQSGSNPNSYRPPLTLE